MNEDLISLTILRMVKEANLGGDPPVGLFRKYDDIVVEIGDKVTVDEAISRLESMGYIREVSEDFQNAKGYELGYKAYKITELGKSGFERKDPTHVFQNIQGSNIAFQSPGAKQTIHAKDLDKEIQQKIDEFDEAVKTKNPRALKKAFGYIADKSVEVAIAITTGTLIR